MTAEEYERKKKERLHRKMAGKTLFGDDPEAFFDKIDREMFEAAGVEWVPYNRGKEKEKPKDALSEPST